MRARYSPIPAALFAAVCSSCPSELAAQPVFEAASVRLHKLTGPADVPMMRNGPLVVSSSLLRLEGYTIYGLVMDAWNLRDFQISLAPGVNPDDVADTTYDIIARAPGDAVPRLDEVRAMLRSLLIDRFQLRVHPDSKERPVYELRPAKGGAHLKPSHSAGSCTVRTRLAPDGRNSDEIFSNCGPERLADRLGNLLGSHRPVLDRTGMTGPYDFHLIAIPEYRTRDRSEPVDIDPTVAVKELGLKLVPGKAKIDILVIDSLGKLTEN
jgi:uncharacterized protein (TIGR03435 family)